MTTEKNWKELIEIGKELHEKSKDKRLPGEITFEEFRIESGVGKHASRKMLDHLIEAGLVTVRSDGIKKYYSPKK